MSTSRTYLITGASKGIGRALAQGLAAAGHGVVGIARRVDDPDFPGTLVSADLSDRQKASETLDDLVRRFLATQAVLPHMREQGWGGCSTSPA